MIQEAINNLIDRALIEDIGDGDHSSLSSIPPEARGKARLIIKEEGVIAGIAVSEQVFARLDPGISFSSYLSDGDRIKSGDIGFEVEGLQQSLLKAERLVLNILQRMSGIATETRRYADSVKEFNTRILDTRKTTPGFRAFEKEAVRIGGGVNHRMGLFDMIMLKDNHVDFAGGIDKAIDGARKYLKRTGKDLLIEIEVRNFDEINQVIKAGGVDRIMLDNFSPEETRRAVEIIGKKIEIESSGGITYDTIRDYAACGVDYISVGALTHHIKSLDMSLKAV
jgi:nicotinate-nucleotide pyrophosphorylase (carboxylating)